MTETRSLSTQARILPVKAITSIEQSGTPTPSTEQQSSIQDATVTTNRPKRKLVLETAAIKRQRPTKQTTQDDEQYSEEGSDDDDDDEDEEYREEESPDKPPEEESDNDEDFDEDDDRALEANPNGMRTVITAAGKRYACSFDGCFHTAKRPSRLTEHENTHRGIRPFVCDSKQTKEFCGKSFFRRSHLTHHVKTMHDKVRPYTCTIEGCNKAFTTKQHQTRHEKTHENEGRGSIKCRVEGCCENFRKKTQLDKHMRVDHLGLNPHVCNWANEDGTKCPMAFPTKAKLNTHKSREHKLKGLYICDSCPAVEGSQMQWNGTQHANIPQQQQPERTQGAQRIPSEELIITSNPMNAILDPTTTNYITAATPPQPTFSTATSQTARVSFNNFSDFMEHVRQCHPPKCTVCQEICSSDSALREHHLVKHIPLEARQNFPCGIDGCTASFTRRSNLKTHVKTVHIDERPFVCDVCGERFGHKAVMKRHRLTKHPEPGQELPKKKQAKKRERLTKPMDTIQLLTGEGYDESGRNIECALKSQGCQYRFARPIDLANHLASKEHGFSPVDAMDMVETLGYGRVSMKGMGDIEDEIGYMEPELENQLQREMQAASDQARATSPQVPPNELNHLDGLQGSSMPDVDTALAPASPQHSQHSVMS